MSGDSETRHKLAPGDCLGPYKIERPLGSAASADVYLARHTVLDARCTLKVVRNSQAENWERNGVRILSTLSHPNIARVRWANRINGCFVIAMDHAGGASLRDLLREKGKLPPAEALRIVSCVASALDYVHTLEFYGPLDLVRLEIEPSNIFVAPDGAVKISDFGMGQGVAAEPAADRFAGCAAYLAPEEAQGRRTLQSDVWTTGMLLFELALGRTPLGEESLEQRGLVVSEQEMEEGSDFVCLPDPVRKIILRCLRRDPSERFASAHELVVALADATAALNAAQQPKRLTDQRPGSKAPANGPTGVSPGATSNVPAGASAGDSPSAAPELSPEERFDELRASLLDRKWYSAVRAALNKSPAKYYGLAGIVLVMLASLGYGSYRLWKGLQTTRVARPAITKPSSLPPAPGPRAGTEKGTARGLPSGTPREKEGKSISKPTAARGEWEHFLILDKSPDGSYESRIALLRTLVKSYPGTVESRLAQERLRAMEDPNLAYRAAQEIERKPDAKMCAILAKWKDLFSAAPPGRRRDYAQSRIKYWSEQVENFNGYADLSIRYALGIPAGDIAVFDGGRPDPYFLLLDGSKVLYRSRTFKNMSSPLLDARIRIQIRPGMKLSLEAWDEDPVFDDLLVRRSFTPLPLDGQIQVTRGTMMISLEIQRDR